MTMANKKRFKSRILRVLFHILPSRTKRMVFLTTLTAKVTGLKEMDRVTRVQLQSQFNLCKDPDAIALPLAYNEKIWGNRPIDSLIERVLDETNNIGITEQELTRYARQIVAMMPCWLVYGQTMEIVKEVRLLLSSRNELLPVS